MKNKNNDRMKKLTLHLDGEEIGFNPGETLYEVAERRGIDIPTLCYDSRLDPFGGCRMCIVEVEGSRNPVASCTAKAASGMRVKTAGGRLDMHRRVLLEMVTSENREIDVDPLSGYASQELKMLTEKYDARHQIELIGNVVYTDSIRTLRSDFLTYDEIEDLVRVP